MCFTCFSCQFVFNKRFLKIYCLSVHSFFLVSFTSMYTTLKIISRKFLGVSLIWTFFSHVGAIFFKQPCRWFQFSLEEPVLTEISSYSCQQFNWAWSVIFFSQVFASRLSGCTPSVYKLKLYCVLVADVLWSPFLYLDFVCRSFENFGE